ncbi:MAG: hypothetical protein IKW86_07605 [Salinivirgaceae bacterium]|nr:hypothetical protein [Salinivirgaceae bacterium]
MKKLFATTLATALFIMVAVVQLIAQEKFAYQAVIRDSEGNLITQGTVGLRFSLTNAGKAYYVEAQTATPNQYGNVSVIIGDDKNKVSGSMADVPWSTLDVTLKVEVDVNGGTDYISLGETKLNPVPYAMYAASVDKAVGVGSAAKDAETLFEVDDRDGRPVFAVTNDGIVVYVDDQDNGKMKRSGFLVTGREATKGEPAKEYFAVTTDGTQIFVDPDASGKLRRSGFLVTGRDATKAGSADYLSVDGNGTTVYVDDRDDSKLRRSGFLVTGRDATKAGGQEMFAVDGSQTIVYVDEQDGGKLRRSGFLVTGRDATKADNGQILSINSERTDFQTKAFSVANYAPQGSATATAPVSVLVVSNQQVAMKSDIALEGDMLEAAYGNFEHEYTFDLQMLCGTNYSIMFDTLLARAGVKDKDEYSGYYDSLMYVFDDGLLVGADGEDWWAAPRSLYFDEDFRRTDEGSAMLSIEKVYEEYSTIWFAVHNEDTAFKTTLQFALGYYDDSWNFHTVLFTVNLTVDRMIYEYGIESGKVQYLFTHHNGNGNLSTDTIDYCFSDRGWNNFYCVSDYLNKDNENNIGRGKYQYVSNFNSKSESNAIGGMNFLCTWNNGGWTPLNTGYSFPMFSVAGVAMPIEGIFFNGGSGVAGMQLLDFNMNEVADAGIVNNYTISDNKTIDGVKKYTFTHITDSIRLYTFYTYQGLVLQIDRTNVIDDKTMIVLKCISFDSNVGEQSLHRWLKNSGVTNYDVIASHFGDYVYNDGSDHYYVNLDLPSGTLWAANNVGAPSPYDWGDYLAWGELAEKGSYSQNGYNVKELISSVNNPNDVGLINDAAWWWGNNGNGSSWCMPSSADWQELIDECFWVWVIGEPYVRVYKAEEDENKGRSYYIPNVDSEVIDELNGVPCLYLPFSGSFEGTTLRDSDIKGLYWASDVSSDPTNAYSLEFGNQRNKQVRENKRYQGLQVRAVSHAHK